VFSSQSCARPTSACRHLTMPGLRSTGKTTGTKKETLWEDRAQHVEAITAALLILVLLHNIPGVRGTRDASGVVSVSISTPYTYRPYIGDRRSNSVFHSLALRSSPSPSVSSCRERGVREFPWRASHLQFQSATISRTPRKNLVRVMDAIGKNVRFGSDGRQHLAACNGRSHRK
jgi:hypothetical protein